MLLTISGIDGSGKSTLANQLESALIQKGYKVKQIEFPCSTIWTSLEFLNKKGDYFEKYGGNSQSVGFALNLERFSFIKNVVCPNLEIYQVVILQRYLLDFASIGLTQQAGESELFMLKDISKAINVPTQSLFLDTDQDIAFERIQRRGGSLDIRETAPFHKKLYNSYQDVYSKGIFPCVRLNGNLSVEEVSKEAMTNII